MWQPLKWGSLRSPTAGRITDLSPQLLCPEIHHCVHEESTRFRGCSQPDCDSPDPGRHETPLIGNLTHVLLIRFTKLFWELNEPHSMIFPFDFLPNLYIDFSHFFLPAVLWSFWIYGLVSGINYLRPLEPLLLCYINAAFPLGLKHTKLLSNLKVYILLFLLFDMLQP